MQNIEVTTLPSRLRALLAAAGLPEAVGGLGAFDAGIDALKSGLLTVAAELANAQQHDVALSDAVFETERFPHTCEMHGVLFDVLKMDAPEEMATWFARIAAAGPFPDAPEVSRAIAAVATTAPNALHRVLARLGLFELLCLQQRLTLKKDGVDLVALNGRRRDVEILAEQEVNVACALATSSANLLSVEDPLALVMQMTTTCLARHVDTLRDELGRLSTDIREHIERRQLLLDAVARVEPADGILIMNMAEDASGEERLTPRQLRRLHPLLLGDLSDDVMYKRLERMPERVKEGAGTNMKSFADIIIEAMAEVRS